MTIVDTHCHAGLGWYEPIELLLYQMNLNDVDQAVLIQTRGTYDSTYLFESGERFPGRFAVVVMVDPSRPDAPARLEALSAQGAVGVRLGPSDRSPGPDPLAIWRTADELGLVVSSSLGSLEEFASDEFKVLVEELPDLPIIIEHLGGVGRSEQPPYTTYRKVLALANYPNTYIKLGGLGEISARPPLHQPHFSLDYTPPFIEMALDAFGARRTMWGSDYPPVSRREGYRNALRGVMDHPALKDPGTREWVMGKTALNLFRLDTLGGVN